MRKKKKIIPAGRCARKMSKTYQQVPTINWINSNFSSQSIVLR